MSETAAGGGRPSRSAADRPFRDTYQLSEKVAAYIRDRIMAGALRAGQFVRTEHLAAELGISATPVREALMALQGEGFVRWEPRRGFRVVPITAQDVTDLFDVQAYIAGELAARAALQISAEDATHMACAQERLEAAARTGDAELVDALNHDIHRTINRAADSPRLTVLLGLVVHYVPRRFFGAIDGWAEASAQDHLPIFTALAARDPQAARLAMAEHVRHAGRLLRRHLENVEAVSASEQSAGGSPS